ncbi:VOC family protein [Alginatibacterium sediminis]|uniref:VOC family protein n=1 Tax=Alginatibacterium sediminis TaxID=2164068 RepID=A0A420EGW2_9ALTE|nr:VOC family protein [Alginatibacterium sediminis]RKF19952.1 VOC family protein [Alginatibacterium sediminis]
MFSHIFISVSDFEKSYQFYSSMMKGLGLEERFCDRNRPWAGWHSAGESRPYFFICHPYDGKPHIPGNGQVLAFMASDRTTVRAIYDLAIEKGGHCEGPPGLRPEYHDDFYGAYFRDYDGNKLCIVCHEPEIFS